MVADKYTYGVHGESGSLAGNPYRFTGRRLDPETGLYYYRARYYSASLGRFMQNDPIGYAGGDNLYGYVLNDPTNATDPDGRCPTCIGALGGAIVGLAAQGISDFALGNELEWQNYAGAAAGGAAGGALLFTSLNPYAAGALASATQNIVTQNLNMASGKQRQFDVASLGVQSTVGGITGGVLGAAARAGVFPGLRNAYTSLSKQILTKLENGTIGTMRPSTAVKTYFGQAQEWAPEMTLAPATDGFSEHFASFVNHSLK